MKSPALELAERPAPGETDPIEADRAFQRAILPGVSRTFALTIPELPEATREVVTNAYLLCRIADTIEDDPALAPDLRRSAHEELAQLVEGGGDARAFATSLAPRLSDHTLAAERDLVRQSARVLRVTRSFGGAERAALARCLRVMCSGMPRFARGRRARGLADLREYHDYCYYVAGVVGEMLTELFCAHSPAVAARHAELSALAVSFGQGLQMTNILKDVWDDLERGYCWLPRDVFERAGFDLDALSPDERSKAFEDGLGELLGIARGHLRRALDYSLLIPAEERGIRRFCLWALGMAVLTLRRIDARRDFRSSREVKISRRTVRTTVALSNLCLGSDRALRALFALCAAGLPAAVPFDPES